MYKKNAPATNNGSTQDKGNYSKQSRILAVLRQRSLNRFEAEHFGDHCLHSTISSLRKQGYIFFDEWEEVPNRFGTTTRVKRYRLIKRAN